MAFPKLAVLLQALLSLSTLVRGAEVCNGRQVTDYYAIEVTISGNSNRKCSAREETSIGKFIDRQVKLALADLKRTNPNYVDCKSFLCTKPGNRRRQLGLPSNLRGQEESKALATIPNTQEKAEEDQDHRVLFWKKFVYRGSVRCVSII